MPYNLFVCLLGLAGWGRGGEPRPTASAYGPENARKERRRAATSSGMGMIPGDIIEDRHWVIPARATPSSGYLPSSSSPFRPPLVV